MRVVESPVGIVKGGRGFVVHDDPPQDQEDRAHAHVLRVEESEDYALCDEAGQRVLIAVARAADEDGIHVGAVDPDTGIPQGVSVPALALRAGVTREVAEVRLRWLCQEGMLISFQVPFGTVLVLPDYEETDRAWGTM